MRHVARYCIDRKSIEKGDINIKLNILSNAKTSNLKNGIQNTKQRRRITSHTAQAGKDKTNGNIKSPKLVFLRRGNHNGNYDLNQPRYLAHNRTLAGN